MKRSFRSPRLRVLAICFLSTGVSAHADSDITVTAGSRTDELHWSIAGPGGAPNIISELRWNEVEMAYFAAQLSVVIDSMVLRASFGRGTITSGKNQDSDFSENNRGCEFSRSNNDAGNGSAQNYEFMVGFEFPELVWANTQIVPLMGYGQNDLKLTMTHGNQTLWNALCIPVEWGRPPESQWPTLGPFPGLNSSYDASWGGLLLGGEAYIDITPQLRMTAQYLRRWIDYEAEANWNLRTGFAHPVSFTHSATGVGDAFSIALSYQVDERVSYGVQYAFETYRTDAGRDLFFFSDGSISSTVLNEVYWRSSRWLVSLTAAL